MLADQAASMITRHVHRVAPAQLLQTALPAPMRVEWTCASRDILDIDLARRKASGR